MTQLLSPIWFLLKSWEDVKLGIPKLLFERGNTQGVWLLFAVNIVIFWNTLPETNIAPENRPLEKEIPIGNHHFWGYVSFRECRYLFQKKRWRKFPTVPTRTKTPPKWIQLSWAFQVGCFFLPLQRTVFWGFWVSRRMPQKLLYTGFKPFELVNLDSFPKFRGKNKQRVRNHHLDYI